MEIICVDCGKKFENINPRALRCPECKAEHIKAYKREYDRKRYEREKAIIEEERRLNPDLVKKPKYVPEVKKDLNECRRKKSCYYGTKIGGIRICDYLSITGVRRPSPVEGCYMYKRRSKKSE